MSYADLRAALLHHANLDGAKLFLSCEACISCFISNYFAVALRHLKI
nr:hypothetical protein [Scytonema sp. UIC 10036]